MTMHCDICEKPHVPGEGLYGGRGDGGRSGAIFGAVRHYQCHIAKYGKPSAWGARTQLPPSQPIKAPIVTKGETNYSDNAARTFRVLDKHSEMGRSRVYIECPFCFSRFWAYIWSISGGGKRCPHCKAMHASFGNAYPLCGNEDL